MVQIKFLSDYANVFLDSEGVESVVFFISRRADKPSGENAISTSICLLACFSICLGNQHLPYGGEREGADVQIIIVMLMLLPTSAPN